MTESPCTEPQLWALNSEHISRISEFQATDAEPLALSSGALTYPILTSHLDLKQNDFSLVPHESYKELGMGGESTVTPDSQRVAIPTSSQPLLLTQGAR